MSLIKEFREFAQRGNVVDLAVAVVMGAAFNPIVKSFVDNIMMPPIGILLGKVDFKHLSVTLLEAQGENKAVVLGYGIFIQTIIDFTLTAFAVFLLVRTMNRLKKKEAPAPEPEPVEPETPADIALLTEIRDLLKK